MRLPSPWSARERERERWMAAGPDPIFRRDIIIPGESPASRGNTRYYVLLSDPTIDRHGGDVSIATRRAGMGADKWRGISSIPSADSLRTRNFARSSSRNLE